ncbi:hypothetical protein BDCR2A_01403 [Borrelia duttonii CR2A]|uniref:Uncharacterized protein n=1 Tax=Borrelia duttonii CR2A TaxID=1432657 RepID=W6TGT0_9SPIR|nr:hypothetical protein [Borrelia duttonii]ETZ17670.1 hypothetical protein BDCR2A_01403 [Borrelia duttonii CR2A]
MISIKKFFKKIKHQKNDEIIFNNSTNNIIEINSKEIINFCTNYLLISNSTELKAIGILLSSGIPLSQFTKKNFTITNYTHDTITYTSSSNLQIRNHTLVNSTLIINAIYFLKKHKFNIIYIKLNRILKKLFRTNITTKHLEYIYSIILQSLNKKDNSYFYESILKHPKYKSIKLVSKPTSLNSLENLIFINSFENLRIHNTANLLFYKNSNNELKSTIANLIESFFLDQNSNKDIHTLKSYINLNLKQMDIPYKKTHKIQKQIFSNIFVS